MSSISVAPFSRKKLSALPSNFIMGMQKRLDYTSSIKNNTPILEIVKHSSQASSTLRLCYKQMFIICHPCKHTCNGNCDKENEAVKTLGEIMSTVESYVLGTGNGTKRCDIYRVRSSPADIYRRGRTWTYGNWNRAAGQCSKNNLKRRGQTWKTLYR